MNEYMILKLLTQISAISWTSAKEQLAKQVQQGLNDLKADLAKFGINIIAYVDSIDNLKILEKATELQEEVLEDEEE